MTLWHALDGMVVEMKDQWYYGTRIHLEGVEFTPGGHLAIPCEDRLVLLNSRRPFDVVAYTPLVRWPQEKRSNTWFVHAWSPDRALYALCRCMHTPSHDVIRVTVYRSETLETLFSHVLEGQVSSTDVGRGDGGFAFSHDGRRLLSIQPAGPESICWIWDTSRPAATALPPRKLMIDYVVVHSTFNPVDSTQLFIASKEGVIEVRDVASGAVLTQSSRLHSPTGDSEDDPQYSSNGLYVTWGNSLYAIGVGIVINDLFEEGLVRSHISFSPDGTRLVAIRRDKTRGEEQCLLWKADEHATHWESFAFDGTQSRHGDSRPLVNCVSFSPDSRFLAIRFTDGWIDLWNVEKLTHRVVFTHPDDKSKPVERPKLAFSPDGKILCYATQYGVHFHPLHGLLPN